MRALRRRVLHAGPMRSVCAGLALLAVLLTAAPWAIAQNFGTKQVQGKVFGNGDAPLSGAIVYLENSRNNDIKSYITEKDGAYHFAGIAADTDFTVWAAFQGKKSPTKKLSSFDSRKQVYLDLHIKE